MKCDYCGMEIDGLPFNCRRCSLCFCHTHRFPENHNCSANNRSKHRHFFYTRKKGYYEVEDKYKNEYVGIKKGENKTYTNNFDALKGFVKFKYYKVKYWFNEREHRAYPNWNAFAFNILWIVILSLSLSTIYHNIEKLNEIILWFLPLGGTLLLINVYFLLKYIYIITKRVRYWYWGARNGIKYLLCFLILILVWLSYQDRDSLFDGVIETYNKTNFSSILPIEFSGDIFDNGPTSKYLTDPKEMTFKYIVKGETGTINFTVYGGLNNYLSSIPREISYYGTPPSDKDFILKNIDNLRQKEVTKELVTEIQKRSSEKDQQAKIAISLVQNIPYDMVGFKSGNLNSRYSYEVLYDNTGVCGEKSQLLALILRELGFGVAIFDYELESHQAIGIKCSKTYSYLNSGYCFVETTQPAIITEVPTDYIGVGELKSTPEIIVISDGYTLGDIEEEYSDANALKTITAMGSVLDTYYYNRWYSIINKYGIETANN